MIYVIYFSLGQHMEKVSLYTDILTEVLSREKQIYFYERVIIIDWVHQIGSWGMKSLA